MVYLDHDASTPIDPRVADVVWEVMREHFANPSSMQHASGRAARDVIEGARGRVATLVGASTPQNVVFTSGASEAAAISIIGTVLGASSDRPNVVVSATEHKAVLEAAASAASLAGGHRAIVPVDAQGCVDLQALNELVDDKTALVAVMGVNNETGVVGDLRHVAEVCQRVGAVFFSDLTQGYGKLELTVEKLGVDTCATRGRSGSRSTRCLPCGCG
jgi:cysteine desulfurase